jgi:hypothetical protein
MATARIAISARSVQQHEQVLSRCVPFTTDTKYLVRMSVVSQQIREDVVAYVQQNLPSLVDVAITSGLERGSELPKTYWGDTSQLALDLVMQPLRWLLSTAGPAAVAAPAVTRALLRASQDIPKELHDKLPAMAYQYGLQLPIAQLVAASREQLRGMDKWMTAAGKQMLAGDPAKGDAEGCFLQCMMSFCSDKPGNVRTNHTICNAI